MKESKESAKASRAATKAEPEAACSIVRRVPRLDPNKDRKERKLGGDYRVIHGSIIVPRPPETFLNADGTEKPFAVKWDDAIEGDVVHLTDLMAAICLDADVVEPLDAKPSRVGKVTHIPPVARNYSGMTALASAPPPHVPAYRG